MTSDRLPAGYADLLREIKADVTATRVRAVRAASAEMINLYWRIGTMILQRQEREGWGAAVIDRLAADLRRELGEQRGWNRPNLYAMRAFAATWTSDQFVSPVGRQLPWSHIKALLRVGDVGDRDWYAAQAVAGGWSKRVLEHHIATDLRRRVGVAQNNFPAQLGPDDADLAREMVKDPYVFDFLGLDRHVSERELEDALIDRLSDTLREFGCAYVGRQVRLDVDGDQFTVDLLLLAIDRPRYIVVELKIGRFHPADLGQLSFYVCVVDEQRRLPEVHAPTIGILVCTQGNEQVVRYALRSSAAPLAVATYTCDTLPSAERDALPSAAQIAAAVIQPPPPS